jgi:multicomponent Na+:H+ antiporter subunit A
MTIDLFILLLVGFMLLAGLIAVESSDLLSAIISLGAAGSALCVIFILLGAPDLAFPEVVVEVVTLVLLIRVIMTRRDTSAQTPRDTLRTGVVLLVGGILLVTVYFAAGGFGQKGNMPPFGQPVMANAPTATMPAVPSTAYLAGAKADTGVGNSVVGILLDYRSYDALAQGAVIFAALLGGYVMLRRVGRKKENEANQS